MLCSSGSSLVSNCPSGRLVAARGFYNLFYQWTRIGVDTHGLRKTSTRSFHKPIERRATAHLPSSLQQFPKTYSRSFFNFFRTIPALPDLPAAPEITNSPPSPPIDEPSLSSSLRILMRSVPHSVVVLTTSDPIPIDSSNPTSHFKGMTLSSFTTLTLDPEPTISFNIRTPSSTLDSLHRSRSFLIHILAGNEEGAQMADAFASGRGEKYFEGSPASNGEIPDEDVEAGVFNTMPAIVGKAVKSILVCEVLGSAREEGLVKGRTGFVRVGDHVLVLAKVTDIVGNEEEWMGNGDGPGLCYSDGKYRGIGGVIDLEKE